jgi:hypothetical protein
VMTMLLQMMVPQAMYELVSWVDAFVMPLVVVQDQPDNDSPDPARALRVVGVRKRRELQRHFHHDDGSIKDQPKTIFDEALEKL